jgi:hypothetical protein
MQRKTLLGNVTSTCIEARPTLAIRLVFAGFPCFDFPRSAKKTNETIDLKTICEHPPLSATKLVISIGKQRWTHAPHGGRAESVLPKA